MNGITWRSEDDKVLKRLYPMRDTEWLADQLGRSVAAVYHRAGQLGVCKTAAYLRIYVVRVRSNLIAGGAGTRFRKGQAPANKGLRRPGWSMGRMRETQFKPGDRRKDTKMIGDERIIQGYRYVKVAEVPNVAYTVNWKAVHVLEWERANGRPLPDHHLLRFRDGNRLNVDLQNLELLSRADHLRRQSVHNLPKELALAIQLRGALVRQINRRTGK